MISALLLAAGRGQRMRPLTDRCPKPLLDVQGRPLLQWWLDALRRAEVKPIVINTAWLGEQIETYFEGHSDLRFSSEGQDFGHALETLGGIARALPALTAESQEVFWVLAGDIFAPGFSFDASHVQDFVRSDQLAHLWLVPNPPQHPQGDFFLDDNGQVHAKMPSGRARSLTFSAVAIYRKALFAPPWCEIEAGNPKGIAAPLAPLLRAAMAAGRVSGQVFHGFWADVGTPERLHALNEKTSIP